MNDPIPTSNIVIAVLVVLFVTLAMGQVIVFNLTKDTQKNLLVHKAIAYLGMGAAFYALFLARMHFSIFGWAGLAGAVVVIVFVGSMIQKYKKKKAPPKTKPSPAIEHSGQAESIGKVTEIPSVTETPSFVFEWVGGFFAVFWGLVFISPLLWYFFGDERAYLDLVQSYWASLLNWLENP